MLGLPNVRGLDARMTGQKYPVEPNRGLLILDRFQFVPLGIAFRPANEMKERAGNSLK